MANMLFANNANTILANSLSNSSTSMSVTSATNFPSPTGSQYFYCTLADAATQTTIEIVKVTDVSGTTFTIVRGQDGTTGTVFAAGDVVSLRLVRVSLNDFPKLDENNTFSYAPTFNTSLAVGSGGTGFSSATQGQILFGQGSFSIGNTPYLFWDNTNLRLGIGSNTPSYPLHVELSQSGITTSGLIKNGNSATSSDASLLLATANGNWEIKAGRSIGAMVIINANGNESVRFFNSGGVSIGNTTDPGTNNLSVTGTVKTGGYTVATLPTGITGARTYVTDSLAPAFGSTVVGGGSVTIPVFYNGSNWIVG